jgi:hypothetical protein
MMLHIVPKLFARPGAAAVAALIDLTVEPFGLRLRGDVDLDTRFPHPNKRIAVACRKKGRKALNGILIQVPAAVNFEYTARWAIDAEFVSTHRVMHRLLDKELDAVSDDMSLWFGTYAGNGHQGWASRLPAWAQDLSPCQAEPVMEVIATNDSQPVPTDLCSGPHNRIYYREQTFDVPTIEMERFYTDTDESRMPPRESAFVVH